MLSVTDAATSFDLTTVAKARTELDYVDGSRDAQLAIWVQQASNVISDYCNRVFAVETVTETIRLTNCPSRLFLTRVPVTSIETVTECDVVLSADEYEIDLDTGVLLRLCNDRQAQWRGHKVIVTYSAGYSALPKGIERAAILLVKSYAMASGRDPITKTETIEGLGSASYFSDELPPEVEALLAPHRNISIG